MTLSLTVNCTNTTGVALSFESPEAIHGTNPMASPNAMASGASSVVTAQPIDKALGPSPEGTFIWTLSSNGDQFVFAYDLHDDPISLSATSVPPGYAVPTCTMDSSGNATVTMASSGVAPPVVMPQIETIVFIMMENRSLDNVLGWLQTASNVTYFPQGSAQFFDGLANATSAQYGSFPPVDGTVGSEPCRVPAFDPYEPMPHVQVQMYANAEGVMPTGYFWSAAPTMSGFAWDYAQGPNCTNAEVMGAYSPVQLPILNGLAANYAVSDRWFSSVPSQTDPNRAFSVCGTSLGTEVNADIDGSTFATANTIFNVLGSAGKSWGLYWQMDIPLGTGEPVVDWDPYTSYYFPMMNQASGGSVQKWSAFMTQLVAGTLPNFCFLEPYWGGGGGISCTSWAGIQGNDYHPPAWVGPAEDSLNTLFENIVASPQWGKMLLVITFDEHGGTFDHVPPTPTVAPDGNVGKSGFKFDRLGVRVPTILVSPYIAGPTVFRAPAGSNYDFDHTSFLATFCKWAGVDPASSGLGARVAVAPTFEEVLSSTPSSNPAPSFTVPAGYAEQGGGVGAIGILSEDAVRREAMQGASMLPAKVPLDIHEFRETMDAAAEAGTVSKSFTDLLKGS